MSHTLREINDNEIRIISSDSPAPSAADSEKKNRKGCGKSALTVILAVIAVIFILVLVFCIIIPSASEQYEPDELEITDEEPVSAKQPIPDASTDSIVALKSFVQIKDTVVDNQPLTILTPENSTPRLYIGADALLDSSAVLVVQAADIRRDNGGIVGAYVMEGNLISRGQSKSGFCAIINGKPVIGVADSTPYFEQAIENGGYFFRQYPLVVAGQSVDNKLKTSSLRKALAELDGRVAVILSHKKMTLNQFSQVLSDLGVSNAIYLVGSSAYGFAKDSDGHRTEFGTPQPVPSHNVNYIVWE